MLKQFILGIVQGVSEWFPVSSEGMIFLTRIHIFKEQLIFDEGIQYALFLHAGTFLAAFIYFYKDIVAVIKALFSFRSASLETQKLFIFLLITTTISGVLGWIIVKISSAVFSDFLSSGKLITRVIAILLLITAYLQLKSKGYGFRETKDIQKFDGILLGLAQAIAVLPGLSRSGMTVSSLLLRKFDKKLALKLSFLMSMPLIFIGNIVLNFNSVYFLQAAYLLGLITSFVFGFLTIHLLFKFVQKINFGIFLIFFACVLFASSLL